MNALRTLFAAALVLVLPHVTFAQDSADAAWEEAPQSEAPAHVALGTILGGSAGAATSFGLSVGVAALTFNSTECPADAACSFGQDLGNAVATASAFISSYALGSAPLIALGAWSGGNLAGGSGGYGYTLLGSSIGTALGGGAFTLVAHAAQSDAALYAGLALIPVLQVAGAAIGYHLSHRAASASERRVAPLLGFERGGATLGLAGAF